MKFGETPLAEAEGAILAHSRRAGDRVLRKGRVLTAEDIAALAAAGESSVITARLEPGDVGEDDAARRVAAAAAGANVTASSAATGRCNLYAAARGLAVIDSRRLEQVNAVDEALTVATLRPCETVEARQMVATVKVVTFALPDSVVEAAARLARGGGALIRVAPFQALRVGLIQTRLPGLKEAVLDKTTETTRARVGGLGARFGPEVRCSHEVAEVARALEDLQAKKCDIVLIIGASAIVDRRDVVPEAVVRAGGGVDRLGLPVDPGNLTLLARLGPTHVLGLPGSARSPRLQGCDLVLRRLVAGLPLDRPALVDMGVGGLLKEIPGRPLPRAAAAPGAPARRRAPRVAALVLAAGQSRRMGTVNKLLADVGGMPMVRRVVDSVLASPARPVIVVTGHEAERVRAALVGCPVTFVHNADYRAGISTSLRCGLAALDWEADGVLVCLGDMPHVTAAQLDRLVSAFDPAEGHAICVPTHGGKRGNPVLWARRYFPEMMELSGDVGARHLIGEHADAVREVEIDDESVLVDIDSPAALAVHGSAKSHET